MGADSSKRESSVVLRTGLDKRLAEHFCQEVGSTGP